MGGQSLGSAVPLQSHKNRSQLEVFGQVTLHHLLSSRLDLQRLEQQGNAVDPQVLERLMRTFRTIRGVGQAFGLHLIGALLERMEAILALWKERPSLVASSATATLVTALELLRQSFILGVSQNSHPLLQEQIRVLQNVLDNAAHQGSGTVPPFDVHDYIPESLRATRAIYPKTSIEATATAKSAESLTEMECLASQIRHARCDQALPARRKRFTLAALGIAVTLLLSLWNPFDTVKKSTVEAQWGVTRSVPLESPVVPSGQEADPPVIQRETGMGGNRSLPQSYDVHRELPRGVLIAIDPGHGGKDTGATGPSGIQEKNVTLAIGQELLAQINSQPGMTAFLTRTRDVFLPLHARMEKAREMRADLFVSIHTDAVSNDDVQGASVYVLSQKGASSKAARWLAERENRADLAGGVKLITAKDQALAPEKPGTLQSMTSRASQDVAYCVLRALTQIGRPHHRKVQRAGFAVLKSPVIPSVLVETAYITNPEEEAKLADPHFQHQLAESIGFGIRSHFLR